MKKHRAKRAVSLCVLCLALILTAAGLVLRPEETIAEGARSLRVCFDVIIPSLFPFFVVSSLFVSLGLSSYLGFFLEKAMRRVFGLGGACAPALLLGLIGGYPVGVKTAVSIYEKKLCTKEEAEHLLAFCNNSGPAFVFGTVGAGVFGSASCGLLLYLTHVISAVTVGVLFRFFRKRDVRNELHRRPALPSVRLSVAFVDAVKGSASSMLNICAFVVFFSVLLKLLSLSKALYILSAGLSLLLSPLGVSKPDCLSLLSGFFELTAGLFLLPQSVSALPTRLSLAAFLLGFAGLSVHFQSFSLLSGTDLKKNPYLIGKLLQAILSSVLTLCLAPLFIPMPNTEASVFGVFEASSRRIQHGLFSACAVFLFLWLMLTLPSLFRLLKKHFQKRIS